MVKTPNEIFRDFETEGNPSSGPHQPIKADIRDYLNDVDDQLATFAAVLNSVETTAEVASFPTSENHLIYDGSIWVLTNWSSVSSAGTIDTYGGMIVRSTIDNTKAWLRNSRSVSVKYFGALGNSSANDYPASLLAKNVAVSLNMPLYFPSGTYIWDLSVVGSAIWNVTNTSSGAARAIPIFGDGPGLSVIMPTNATSIGWQLVGVADWFDLKISKLTVRGTLAGPLVVVGKNDFSDPTNMMRLDDFSVENALDNVNNVALRLNYVAGGTCNNLRVNSYALAVDNVLVAVNGTALECRQAVFVNFSGGSAGNASRAVDFKDGFNYCDSFSSATLENSNWAVNNRSSNSGAHNVTNCQLSNCFNYEIYSSGALSGRNIIIDNCNANASVRVDPSNLVNVVIRDREAVTTPSAPTTTTPVQNTTGRDVLVTYWGLTTLTSISINGVGDGITSTSGSFVLPAGSTVAFTYTGTLTWRWRNVS